MATAAAHPSPCPPVATGLPGRRFDHFFFSGMALLMLVTVFVGFAPSYYLAGLLRAPLPSPIIHVHGALFSCWILLLVTQTSLVSAGRVDVHRRLGIAGFMLDCVRVVVGVLAATDGRVRQAGPPVRARICEPGATGRALSYDSLAFRKMESSFSSSASKLQSL